LIVRPFSDHFSGLSAAYAIHRPGYPDMLFDLLAELPQRRMRVWDCATGSGQAAIGLARTFDRVIATDASAAQVQAAAAHPRVCYGVAQAEAVPFRSRAFDLITVAQALHWLELPVFYAEARRLLAPGGALAVWTYGRQRVDGGLIDAVVDHYYDQVVGPYWPPERRWVESGYRTLRFPFAEVPLVSPPMTVSWTLDELLGYIGTWSATARCRSATGVDPVPELAERLAALWGERTARRRVEWPLSIRAGY
jgi:SAM-dependent methyltransferase